MDLAEIYAGAIARFPKTGEAPRFAHCHGDIADYAEWLLAERQGYYPGAIDEGKMTQAEAAESLVAMSSIALLWRDVAALRRPVQDYPADRIDMIVTLLKPLAVNDAKLAAGKYQDEGERISITDRRDCLLAMIWWLRRFHDGPMHMVEMTLQGREQLAAERARQAA